MIMAMENVEAGRGMRKELHRGSLKKNPAVRFIGIVGSTNGIHIDSGTIEESIVADQKNINRRARKLAAMHVVGEMLVAQPYPAFAGQRNGFEAKFPKIDRPVAGYCDSHGDPEFLQRNWKRAKDIAEAADLGKRHALCRGHQNVFSVHR